MNDRYEHHNSGPEDRSGTAWSATVAAVYAVALLLAHFLLALNPIPLAWGINFMGFLPVSIPLICCLGGAAVVFLAARNALSDPIGRLAAFMERFPLAALAGSIAALSATAFVMQVRHPLLGDSFVVINNLQYALQHAHELRTSHEPLSFWLLYGAFQVLGTTTYPAILDGFFRVELVLLALTVILSFSIARMTCAAPRQRLLLFLFLLGLPSMQLFFGYAEVYAVVLAALMLFMTAAVGYWEKDWPVFLVLPLYVVAFYAHYLVITLLPALVYLCLHEYRRRGARRLLAGAGGALLLAWLLSSALNTRPVELLHGASGANTLTLTGSGDWDQAYPVLSLVHAAELLNLIFLISPFGLALAAITLRPGAGELLKTPAHRFYLLAAAGYLAFLPWGKFVLGLATDWDISAPFFVVINLVLAVLFFRSRFYAERAMAVVIVATAAIALPWYLLNSTIDPHINRVLSLRDRRILPPNGLYQSTYHLAEGYTQLGRTDEAVAIWESYTREMPADPRGFERLLEMYAVAGTGGGNPHILQAYEQCLRLNPGNAMIRLSFERYCIDMATVSLDGGDAATAGWILQRLLSIDSAHSSANPTVALLKEKIRSAGLAAAGADSGAVQ